MADYLNIAGRIRTTASDGVAMEAQEVKDLNLNKSQQEINADVQTELGDRYTKEETYNRDQLNELITTPDVNRVYVIATNLTTAVTDLLPATGSSDTLYNVGNWDGTQYDTTVYSIYGWDGTAYVCLAVRSSIGEVYDISANHPDGQGNPTPYADLAAAIGTNGANIPADIRRGGMSIKFIQGTVQSSDNNYVQYILKSRSFSTNPFDWLGVTEAVDNVSGISKRKIASNTKSIQITDDEDTVIHELTEEYANFKNLKSNNKNVLTEDNLDTLATKTEVEGKQDEIEELISNDEFATEGDSQEWKSDDNTETYVRIDRNGIFGKDFYYNVGNKKKSLVVKEDSLQVNINNTIGSVFPIVKNFLGKDVVVRCTSQSMLGIYKVVFFRNSSAIYPQDFTFKGYWRKLHIPSDITGCAIEVNSFDATVDFEIADIENKNICFVVEQNGNGDYNSLLKACMDASRYDGSIINVNAGVYNLRSEFGDFYGSNFFSNFVYKDGNKGYCPLGIYLMNNIHLRFSPDSSVVFEGDNNNADALKWFGPFFASFEGFTLEGATIVSSNCRYSVHDERVQESDFYKNYYRKCRMLHDNTDAMNDGLYYACIGGGLGVNGLIDIEGCYFDSVGYENNAGPAFSYHNSANANAKSRIVIRDNYVTGKGTFRFGDYGPSTKMTEVLICGNNFGSSIIHNGEAGSTNVNGEIIEWNNIIRSNN